MKNESIIIPIRALHPFEGHPFHVKDDAEMDALEDSVREFGILTPLIVRPMDGIENEYEVISGHRRLHAAKRAGIQEVPAHVVQNAQKFSTCKIFFVQPAQNPRKC